jgi:transcriptional regulator with XRE-family HTH domain
MTEEERRRLGDQLARRRKELGWTVKDVALRTGRQPSRISEIETGRANSTLDALVRAGEVVGLRLLFVPDHRLGEIQALLGQPLPSPSRRSDMRTVFDEVFIPDPEDDDEADL